MSTNKKVSSLKSIPEALFTKFGKIQKTQQCIRESDGGRLYLNICDVLDKKKYGNLTLVYQDFMCWMGKFHTSNFEIYNTPLSPNLFDEVGYCTSTDPDLTVFFSSNYPINQSIASNMQWEKKKGFWVDESINLSFGGPTESNFSLRVSNERVDNKHFLLPLDVQTQVYTWMQEIVIRGHWEKEWNPKGAYLKKPEVF